MINYLFDGSYQGLLTALFESFERKNFEVQISEKDSYVSSFFEEELEIVSDSIKANRVMKGLKQKLNYEQIKQLYWVFLSEDIKARNVLFYIMQEVFRNNVHILENYGDDRVLYFHQMYTKVRRERHRMQAFIRFEKSNDGTFYCMIDPDFNVLPLIASFFKKRYTDQSWLIYDVKRKYGLLYNLSQIIEVNLAPQASNSGDITTSSIDIDEREIHFQTLWKQYFKSTNIEARKNIKLHLQHVPRRYWKYLTEKKD